MYGDPSGLRHAVRASQGPARNSFISAAFMPPNLVPRHSAFSVTAGSLVDLEVLALLPVADVGVVAPELVPLDRHDEVDEGGAEGLPVHVPLGLEEVDRLGQPGRQR